MKTAKAILTDEGKTLTFYYDKRTPLGCSENEFTFCKNWFFDIPYYCRTKVETVIFDYSFKEVQPPRTRYWFCGMENLKTIKGIENLNTSKATSMCGMFAFCGNLETLDLSTFDTKNVTDMGNMFLGCHTLKMLDLSNFNTKKVTCMYSMFYDCWNLEKLDISGFDSKNVKDKGFMFRDCKAASKGILCSDTKLTKLVEREKRRQSNFEKEHVL